EPLLRGVEMLKDQLHPVYNLPRFRRGEEPEVEDLLPVEKKESERAAEPIECSPIIRRDIGEPKSTNGHVPIDHLADRGDRLRPCLRERQDRVVDYTLGTFLEVRVGVDDRIELSDVERQIVTLPDERECPLLEGEHQPILQVDVRVGDLDVAMIPMCRWVQQGDAEL